ncbi:MAG: hypothetical protein KGK09_01540 [Burkholderiales bacterium]|nr:hypothetical protein [Burkholderiales bacterium]
MAALTAALAGCAAIGLHPPVAGQTEAQVLARDGPPTARYAMPGGAARLEYASGPAGRETWMVDIDASGHVIAARQVLNEAAFDAFQRHAAGMSRAQLLRTLGTPGERRGGGWQGGEVWSWRYPNNDCLWFQVSIGDDGRVRDGAYGFDPMCNRPGDTPG